MPRYYKEYGRGYDLDMELAFLEEGGVRYQLGSAGSMLWGCTTCGAEHFREPISVDPDRPENCFNGHGPMELIRLDELISKWHAVCAANGIKNTTIEERKLARLEDEAKRPWNWIFGHKTEADFPLGYVKEVETKAQEAVAA